MPRVRLRGRVDGADHALVRQGRSRRRRGGGGQAGAPLARGQAGRAVAADLGRSVEGGRVWGVAIIIIIIVIVVIVVIVVILLSRLRKQGGSSGMHCGEVVAVEYEQVPEVRDEGVDAALVGTVAGVLEGGVGVGGKRRVGGGRGREARGEAGVEEELAVAEAGGEAQRQGLLGGGDGRCFGERGGPRGEGEGGKTLRQEGLGDVQDEKGEVLRDALGGGVSEVPEFTVQTPFKGRG